MPGVNMSGQWKRSTPPEDPRCRRASKNKNELRGVIEYSIILASNIADVL
jgi:hypothetical protein